ncbi:F-box domain containing protein [Tanacetum coccineum]
MQRESEYSRGLGFDVSTNTFKMVCVLPKRTTFDSTSEDLCTIVHVLGMDHSWREIPQVPPYRTYGDGIFAHGCLYWLGPCHGSQSKTKYRGELICFDVRNEEFTLIYPPKRRCGYSVVISELVDLHGEVGYVYRYLGVSIIEVWVLKQNQWTNHCHFNIEQSFGVLDRWSKDRDIYIGPITNLKVLGRWSKDGDILIQKSSVMKQLFVYSLKSRLFSEVNIAHQEYEFGTYVYMYPASSIFSIRGINKTAHLIKTDLNAG